LQRLVKQTAQENDRLAELLIVGAEAELDRNVLERMTAPLEHLLRNAIVHGIETPEQRRATGKPEVGSIRIELKRDGAQLLLQVSDDGAGLNLPAIRDKAVALNLIPADARLTDDALARFIFEPGFSTAQKLTQDAGRGIGMDVVGASVKQLGGSIDLHTENGIGARFRIRLPLTLAVSQVLMVGVGEETYALPLPAIEGIARIPRADLAKHLPEDGPPLDYGGHSWRVCRLSSFVGLATPAEETGRSATVVLIQPSDVLGSSKGRRVALVVDRLIGNREIVSKGAGAQLSSVPGVTGATLLADGRVVLILDIPALVLRAERRAALAGAVTTGVARVAQDTVMVVDDSVTMRRVAERLLIRAGYRVVLAKDGLDAIAQLQTQTPQIVLLDIEMPRADGFEVASFIRNSPRLGRVPIVMITSRSGDKHRARAEALGVDRYLTKPYQEEQLLAEITTLLGAAR
jgi:chemosensory pili system protein ChpA (sensor histidine kinase/response regulator)